MMYNYLNEENAPKILVQAKQFIGVSEIVGEKHNPVIMGWAKELGLENIYKSDEIAWCGLFIAYVCHKAKIATNLTPKESLWALNWGKFGTSQQTAMLGDVLTFKRKGGGHVGIYVGEDSTHYHVLGGNQGNKVSIVRIDKLRIHKIRRTSWVVSQPKNVRVIELQADGVVSQNES